MPENMEVPLAFYLWVYHEAANARPRCRSWMMRNASKAMHSKYDQVDFLPFKDCPHIG